MRSAPLPDSSAAAGADTAAGIGGGGEAKGLAAGAAGAGAGFEAAGAGAGVGVGAMAAPAPSMTATTVWMGTVWPSGILISLRTPAEGDGISASTLSVEISKSGSSRSTLSPGFLCHLVLVPSKMLSPIWGMTTSTAMTFLSLLAGCREPGGTRKPWSAPGAVRATLLVYSETDSGGNARLAEQGLRFCRGPRFPEAWSDPGRTARSAWGRQRSS